MTAVESYLADLLAVRGTGTAETSGYPALASLLNEVGSQLKPKITTIIHPANSGAGLPDGGFFSTKELRKNPDETSLLKLNPERGVLEVKPVDHDLGALAYSPQVRGYLEHYGQILLTNYRGFAIWTLEGGKPTPGETFFIAESEAAFWDIARHAKDHPLLTERLTEYLRRVLLLRARLAAPRDLAAYLASYAREARARVEGAESNALAPIAEALGEALGIRFEGEKGAHFFRSTLIQTLFYGVFSAWVLWNEGNPKPGDRFRWRESAYHLGLPVLRTLFHQLADPQKLRDLGLEEVLDWTEATLARVERAAFFQRFALGEAVQYFYEPFLAEFDPELRKQFGVWYTPPEIVRYMVAHVDRALQENYGIADGLADPRVVVLDPCCGTGAYLVETLRLIHERLKESAGDAQAGLQTKAAAQTRLFGFELLPAPYVIAHLQIDLQLAKYGAPMQHEVEKPAKGTKPKAAERAGVFLTNALTGWVPPEEPKTLLFPELAAERDAADRVKREAEILVIIGNPPYDGYAGISVEEERGLSEAYRETKAAPKPQGQGLNDLYIRFYRMAERRIVEGAPEADEIKLQPPAPERHGMVCYISNYSWLDGLSHPGMRERFLEVFDHITVDCLNGDKYKTGKKTPEGLPDPSVFSAEHNREGIQVGTAIALLERWPAGTRLAHGTPPGIAGSGTPMKEEGSAGFQPAGSGIPAGTTEARGYRERRTPGENRARHASGKDAGGSGLEARAPQSPESRANIRFRHWWGKEKRAELVASLDTPTTYLQLHPSLPLGLPFVPVAVRLDYNSWPLLTELLPQSFSGVKTSRDDALVSIDRACLESRMNRYFDRTLDFRDLRDELPILATDNTRFDAASIRQFLIERGIETGRFLRYCYRPFDYRWLYWHPDTKLLDEKRTDYVEQCGKANRWFFTTGRTRKNLVEPPIPVSEVADINLLDSSARGFPLYVLPARVDSGASVVRETPDMFGGGGDDEPVPNLTPFARAYQTKLGALPEDLFFHIVALLHAPAYRTENAGALRQDWPRVPLPQSLEVLQAGTALGRQVAALLDPETPVPGVTTGTLRPGLRGLAELTVSGTAKPKTPDLALAARWGYAGQGGVVMPGSGDVRTGTRREPDGTGGDGFVDIHLNATTRWRDVPAPVWSYTLGGYQVLKKWLSYRESALLGRALTPDEALDFTKHVRRITTLLALHAELDANYRNSIASKH